MTRTKAAPETSAPPRSRFAAPTRVVVAATCRDDASGERDVPRGSAGSDNHCVNAVLAAYLDLIGARLATAYPDRRPRAGRQIRFAAPGRTGTRRAIAIAIACSSSEPPPASDCCSVHSSSPQCG
jgi:hypothetical protein